MTQKIFSDLRENVSVSAVGYEIGNDNGSEKDSSLKSLSNM